MEGPAARRQDLVGPLFDNSKIKSVVGEFHASTNIDEILHDSVVHAKAKVNDPVAAKIADEDKLIDRIIAAQAGVKAH